MSYVFYKFNFVEFSENIQIGKIQLKQNLLEKTGEIEIMRGRILTALVSPLAEYQVG